MELTEAVKDLLVQTAKALKGSARRLFMARTVQAWVKEVSFWLNGSWAGIAGRSAKGCTSWSVGSSAWMAFAYVGVSAAKTICHICCTISPPLWMGKPPGGSTVSHDAPVCTTDGDGSASPVDRPKRLHA
jgi:hypothetical protein